MKKKAYELFVTKVLGQIPIESEFSALFTHSERGRAGSRAFVGNNEAVWKNALGKGSDERPCNFFISFK